MRVSLPQVGDLVSGFISGIFGSEGSAVANCVFTFFCFLLDLLAPRSADLFRVRRCAVTVGDLGRYW